MSCGKLNLTEKGEKLRWKNHLHIIGYYDAPLSLRESLIRLVKSDVMKYPKNKHIYPETNTILD
jgi:hypothetical protein